MNYLIQPYGIQLWGDFLGLITLVVIYDLIKMLGLPDAIHKWYWIVAMAYSGWGSLTILPRALYRLDPGVFAYHCFFVVLSAWFIAKVYKPKWSDTVVTYDNWLVRVGVRIGDWFFENVTHRKQYGGEHERL